ncbi:MAG TPA: ABC transporter C-terminal domain-containing protein, partial [Sphingobacteriaceae bacterium]
DKLTEQLFIFDETSHVRIFNGNYTDYRLEGEEKKSETKTAAPAPKEEVKKEVKATKKLSFKEEKELSDLESGIATAEEQLKILTEKLNSGITNHQELANLSREIEEIQSALEIQTMRWMELSELKEA